MVGSHLEVLRASSLLCALGSHPMEELWGPYEVLAIRLRSVTCTATLLLQSLKQIDSMEHLVDLRP